MGNATIALAMLRSDGFGVSRFSAILFLHFGPRKGLGFYFLKEFSQTFVYGHWAIPFGVGS